MGIFGSAIDFISQPGVNNLIQLLMGNAQHEEAQKGLNSIRVPKPYSRNANNSNPNFNREMIKPPNGRFGSRHPSDSAIPGASSISLNDILSQSVNDAYSSARSQNERNNRLRGVASDYKTGLAETINRLKQDKLDIAKGRIQGEKDFDAANREVRRAMGASTRSAAESLKTTMSLYNDFKTTAASMYSSMASSSAQIMSETRDNTAAKLVDANEAISMQTRSQIADTQAAMQAAGVPQAQMQRELATIANNGAKMQGDILQKVAVGENERISNLARDLNGQMTTMAATITNASASMASSTASEMGTTRRSAEANRVALVGMWSDLKEKGAQYRSDQLQVGATLDTQIGQFATSGQVALAQMHAAIRQPVVALGPIYEAIFSATLSLEGLQYGYEMDRFNTGDAVSARFVEQVNNAMQRLANIEEQRHQERVADNRANQQMVAQIGMGVATMGTSLAVAGMDNSSPTPAQPVKK